MSYINTKVRDKDFMKIITNATMSYYFTNFPLEFA